jgi:hypothetical protein
MKTATFMRMRRSVMIGNERRGVKSFSGIKLGSEIFV